MQLQVWCKYAFALALMFVGVCTLIRICMMCNILVPAVDVCMGTSVGINCWIECGYKLLSTLCFSITRSSKTALFFIVFTSAGVPILMIMDLSIGLIYFRNHDKPNTTKHNAYFMEYLKCHRFCKTAQMPACWQWFMAVMSEMIY